MECPTCGVDNPEEAIKCYCDFDFGIVRKDEEGR